MKWERHASLWQVMREVQHPNLAHLLDARTQETPTAAAATTAATSTTTTYHNYIYNLYIYNI